MMEERNALVGNPVGKRPLSRSRHRWEDDIKMLWIALIWLRILSRGGPVVTTVRSLLVS
jgi:hypothetical protein